MRRTKKFFITDRDFEMLHFLWKWKVVSTHALAARFFPEAQAYTAYCRLRRLEHHRYIRSISFRYRKGSAWVLDKKGFQYVLPYLPELSQCGHKAENVLHDFYATAFHLGEWLTHQPKTVSLCSEQELRRLSPELLPSWVPKSQSHRPDGYSRIQTTSGERVIAFETELSLKTKHRYEDALNFYDGESALNAVLWLTGTPTIERSLTQSLRDSGLTRKNIHHFVSLAEFRKNGWMSLLRGGVFNSQSLAQVLVHAPFTELSRHSHGSSCELLLRNSKRPIIPNKTAPAPQSAFAD